MANNRETDLFGETLWDEKAYPREWVEKQKDFINRRCLQRLVWAELEYRTTHKVMPGEERPMTYEQMVKYDNLLRAGLSIP